MEPTTNHDSARVPETATGSAASSLPNSQEHLEGIERELLNATNLNVVEAYVAAVWPNATDRAWKRLEALIAARPKDVSFRYGLALLAHHCGDLELLAYTASQALRRDPNHGPTQVLLENAGQEKISAVRDRLSKLAALVAEVHETGKVRSFLGCLTTLDPIIDEHPTLHRAQRVYVQICAELKAVGG